jgi:hypothetical protein
MKISLNIALHFQNDFALSKYLSNAAYVSEMHQMLTPTYHGTLNELSVPHVQLCTLTDVFYVFVCRNNSALRYIKAFSEG